MITVPTEAESLIAMHYLGRPKKVYKPHTVTLIIVGLLITTFACVWIMLALLITQGSLLLARQASFQISTSQPATAPTFTAPQPSTDSPLTTPFTIASIVFPLFGLIFVAVGLAIIIKALLNRHVRAVLCEYGVAQLGRTGADAFRWEQVATVLDKVNVHRYTTNQPNGFTPISTPYQPNGFTHTSTTISHTYTVVCKDGRRFIFNRGLGQVEQLGQEIQIAVALWQRSA